MHYQQQTQRETPQHIYHDVYYAVPINDPQQQEQQFYQQHSYTPQPPPQYHAYRPAPHESVDAKVLAVFAYLGGWFTGLIVFLFTRENRFVRFHALQSLLFFSAAMIVDLLLVSFYKVTGLFEGFSIMVFMIVNSIAFVGWLVGMFNALCGRSTKLPFVGDFAEQAVNKGQVTVK